MTNPLDAHKPAKKYTSLIDLILDRFKGKLTSAQGESSFADMANRKPRQTFAKVMLFPGAALSAVALGLGSPSARVIDKLIVSSVYGLVDVAKVGAYTFAGYKIIQHYF